MSILEIPDYVIKEVNTLIFSFLWNKRDRIKRNTLIAIKKNGGLQMIDLESKNKALKAAWVCRIIKNKCKNRYFIEEKLKSLNLPVNYIIKSNIRQPNTIHTLTNIPIFWCKVLAFFNQCKYIKPVKDMNDYDFLSQPLWLNVHFTFKDKPLLLKNWSRSNIFYVKDLFDGSGTFLTTQEILNKLINKCSWIQEYQLVKKVFKNIMNKFNTSTCLLYTSDAADE